MFRIRVMFTLLALLMLGFGAAQPTHAATFTVNSTDDQPDANPADGVCATSTGVCTLRAAIQTVNALTTNNHAIVFNTAVFATPTVIQLTSALPAITGFDVGIVGTPSMTVIIDGGSSVRAGFNISAGASVALGNLVLRSGRANNGGAIFNAGTLNAYNLDITGNTASIFGGGIANTETIYLARVVVRGNSGLLGGGIYNEKNLFMSNSTVSGNTGTDAGGGILTNDSTFTVIRQSTIAFNNAGNGGGMDVRGLVRLSNTIVAQNTASGSAPDIFGEVESVGHVLIRSTDGATVGGVTTGNLLDADAEPLNLTALANNGGSTFTHALRVGSVAINAGSNGLALDPFSTPLSLDQRHTGFPRIIGGTVDIGAFEAAQFTLHTTLQGRGAVPTPNPRYVIDARVRFTRANDNALVHSASVTTDTTGTVVFFGLPPAVYRIWVKGTNTLARMSGDVTVNLDENTSFITASLRAGDANDDNQVTLVDFTILAQSFGLSSASAGYDARADFNGDGQITIADFSLLASNFGQAGDAQ